jgi:hypothetical protein
VRKKFPAAARFVDQEWQVIGIQAVWTVDDQGAERMRRDRLQQLLRTSFFEVVG